MKPLDYVLLGFLALALIVTASGCATKRVLIKTSSCDPVGEFHQFCEVVE